MSLPFPTVAAFILFFLSLFVAWKANRKNKLGCLWSGYVALVVFIVSLFSILLTIGLTAVAIENIKTYAEGEKYNAEIISYAEYESEDDEGYVQIMYTPTYKIEARSGKIYEISASYSSSDIPIAGTHVELYFNEATQNIFHLSGGLFFFAMGASMMWIALAFLFVGILMYAFDANMSKYFKVLQAVGMGFLLPFVIFVFEVMLVFAFFFGNDVPTFVSAILLFFILVLGLTIFGYIRMLMTRGLPKWKRTSATSWSADWEEETEEEIIETKDNYEPRSQKKDHTPEKKEMIPLNEELLNSKKNKK